MTQITIDRALLEQALEALSYCEPDCEENTHGFDLWANVLPPLREALAQPQHQSAPAGYVLVPNSLIDKFPEINPSNYGHDDACALNRWGCEVVTAAIEHQSAAPQPQPPNCRHCGGPENVLCAGQCRPSKRRKAMNITIDRAVLEQALEALNHGITEMNHRGCAIECMPLHHATKAIREELVQPQPRQDQHYKELAALGWQAIECPVCGSSAQGYPRQSAQPLSDEQKQEIHNETGAGHALISLVESYITKGKT